MKKISTPYYLIDREKLELNYVNMEREFKKYWKNFTIGYSFKTNSLPWILNFFKEQGAYAEVVSKREYDLAKRIGYGSGIIYNGPIKSQETLKDALERGAIVNIDSKHEIQWIKDNIGERMWRIGIRINFDLERSCPGESVMGEQGGRFGLNYENGEFIKAMEMLRDIPRVKVVGMHLHNSSKTRSLNIYRAISQMATELKKYFEKDLEYIDIGGGFFGDGKSETYEKYAQEISNILKKEYDNKKIRLIIEPGASLIATPISFISTVVDTKEIKGHRVVTTDGSCNNINPLMKEKRYRYNIERRDEMREVIKRQIVAGYTCMEDDILLDLEKEKELCIGDRIEFLDVGSYTMTLSPLFIEYFPKVIVKEGEKYFCVREEWGVEEFIQKSNF